MPSSYLLGGVLEHGCERRGLGDAEAVVFVFGLEPREKWKRGGESQAFFFSSEPALPFFFLLPLSYPPPISKTHTLYGSLGSEVRTILKVTLLLCERRERGGGWEGGKERRKGEQGGGRGGRGRRSKTKRKGASIASIRFQHHHHRSRFIFVPRARLRLLLQRT